MSRLTRTATTLVTSLVVLVGGLLVTTAPPASARIWKVPSPAASLDPLTHLNEFENRIVVLINRHRARAGLHKVRYFDSCIDGFSERWAGHLAASGELVHRNQHRILDRCHLTWVGETLVRGTAITPGKVVRAWLHSPEHRAVIMKPRANRAGVGVRIDDRGRVVGVLNFGDHN